MSEKGEGMCEDEALTKGELLMCLDLFKQDVITEVRQIVKDCREPFDKKWMKSFEVRKMLGLSQGKLQTMRNTGIIKYTKIGGSIYYDKEDIMEMFEKNRVKR